MVLSKENTSNEREQDDLERQTAAEGSSAGQLSMPSTTSGHRDSLGSSPVEGSDSDDDLTSVSDELERRVVEWLRAFDPQVVGACRVDERLKPLFKMDISSGIAEDRLVAHLSRHFEAAEIGTLARCLCVPLVSIRVGKVVKEGTLLCPSAIKGFLQLTLLPTSDLRLSFSGDNGIKEILAVVSRHRSVTSQVIVEEISRDVSGRTFLLSLSKGRLLYFWCSEKSQLLGSELLSKMKDLLGRRPSLSQLTGISEQRLESFAARLRTYLRLPVTFEPYDDISPRFTNDSASSGIVEDDAGGPTVHTSTPEECTGRPLHVLDRPLYHQFPKLIPSSLSLPLGSSTLRSAAFSPHYCWCPPSTAPVPLSLPEPLLLPPLLPELPKSGAQSLDLPSIFPPLPLAFSSQQPGKNQQIPTFMSDPIVHVPVLDVWSSGQGYLVSAGPAISSAVPAPLLPDSESPAEKSARETLRMLMASAPSSTQLLDSFPAVLGTVGDAFPCLDGMKRHGMLVAGSRGLYSGTKDAPDCVAWTINPPDTSSDDDDESDERHSSDGPD